MKRGKNGEKKYSYKELMDNVFEIKERLQDSDKEIIEELMSRYNKLLVKINIINEDKEKNKLNKEGGIKNVKKWRH